MSVKISQHFTLSGILFSSKASRHRWHIIFHSNLAEGETPFVKSLEGSDEANYHNIWIGFSFTVVKYK